MLGVAIVALQLGGVAAQWVDAVRINITLIFVQGAVFLFAVQLALRYGRTPVRLGWVLAVAAILRLTLVFLPPYLSNDIYRYVWDGHVKAPASIPTVIFRTIPRSLGSATTIFGPTSIAATMLLPYTRPARRSFYGHSRGRQRRRNEAGLGAI